MGMDGFSVEIDERQYGAFGKPSVSDGAVKPSPPEVRKEPNPVCAVQDPPRIEVSPDSDVSGHEDICTRRKTSMFLYGAFVEYIRKLYRDGQALVGTPNVRWGRTPQHDGIWVDAEYNWKPENPEFLPAVYVKLGDIQYSFRSGHQDRWVGGNVRNGIFESERVGRGTVTFVHVSRNSGEAIALCDNTRYMVNEFAYAIRQDLCLTGFHEQQCSPLSPAAKESREAYQSATTFAFEFLERWGLKMEAPILKSVSISTDGDGLPGTRKYGIVRTGISDRVPGGSPVPQSSGESRWSEAEP